MLPAKPGSMLLYMKEVTKLERQQLLILDESAYSPSMHKAGLP